MDKLREAARQALGALVRAEALYGQPNADIQTALREALAEQAEQEPVAFIGQGLKPIVPEDLEKLRKHEPGTATLYDTPLYTHPVRTKDLTDYEIEAIFEYWYSQPETEVWSTVDLARAVIAADREKNK